MNFEKITWKSDRIEINALTFSLGQYKPEEWNLGGNCFVLWKDKVLVDQYKDFFKSWHGKRSTMLELGMWDGGSTAFWHEMIEPEVLVGIDHLNKTDTAYFSKWRQQRQDSGPFMIRTMWNTNQNDSKAIRSIIDEHFGTRSLDIVIDDASHHYSSTLASFQTIFPLMKPGSIYIIEDWAWLHWKEWVYQFPQGEELSTLIHQFIQASGSYSDIISSVKVYPGFAVVERGNKELDSTFNLDDHIFLPQYPSTFIDRMKQAFRIVFPTKQ